MEKLIGALLDGRYEILEIVGTGGMAIVYRALDKLENRYVAIKLLREELVSDQSFRKRFLNESRAVAMLAHKNIVDVYDVNFDSHPQYIVMEFIEGRTLKDYMTSVGQMPLKEAFAYCGQILSALRHAHERGVVHRDIKPQNIMLLENGIIKVTDFGIAHVSNFETITMTDNAIGSVHYISPEQARGKKADDRSDIYSVGVILYEMITGKLPFDADTAVSVALMQVQETPRKPKEWREDLPIGAEQIILKAMEKTPSKRYQSARQMQQDILTFCENEETVFDYDLGEDDLSADTVVMPSVTNKDNENEDKKDNKPAKKKTKSDKKSFLQRTLLRNRLFAGAGGVLLAIIFIIAGAGIMFSLGSTVNLIDIPYMVGSTITAVQADSEIANYFKLNIKEQYSDTISNGIIIEQNPTDGKYAIGKEITVVVSLGKREAVVPEVNGVEANQAMVMIKQNDLVPEKIIEKNSSVTEGSVIRCDPPVGTSLSVGDTVKVYVAASTSEGFLKVPDVIGVDVGTAQSRFINATVKFKITYQSSDTVETGYVISQSEDGLSEIDANTEVIIVVSSGPEE